MKIVLDVIVLRNYLISFLFLLSTVAPCFLKNLNIKYILYFWIMALISWCVNFILDNSYKMDKETCAMSVIIDITSKKLENISSDEDIKKFYGEGLKEVKDFYNSKLEARKSFKNEIGVVLGSVGAILGSSIFLHFINDL